MFIYFSIFYFSSLCRGSPPAVFLFAILRPAAALLILFRRLPDSFPGVLPAAVLPLLYVLPFLSRLYSLLFLSGFTGRSRFFPHAVSESPQLFTQAEILAVRIGNQAGPVQIKPALLVKIGGLRGIQY